MNFKLKIAKRTSKALNVALIQNGSYVLGNGASD